MIVKKFETSEVNFEIKDDRFLLAGLGNIGDKYKNTRHNAGFILIDRILEMNNIDPARHDKNFFGDFQRFSIENMKFFIIKPDTYMNDSGRSIKAVMKYYDLLPENLVVFHDDLDIDFGSYKVNFGKGPKEHNGIKSVEAYLATSEFWRGRVGVENRAEDIRHKFKGRDYVLSRFSKEETENLKELSVDIWQQTLHNLQVGR